MKQIYTDTLMTYHLRAEHEWAWWPRLLPDHNLTAYVGPGWLFHTQSYFARPDNTGSALVAMSAISTWTSTKNGSFCLGT